MQAEASLGRFNEPIYMMLSPLIRNGGCSSCAKFIVPIVTDLRESVVECLLVWRPRCRTDTLRTATA